MVTVDRATGQVSSELIPTRDEAWQVAHEVAEGCPHLYTTAVRQQT